MSQNRFTEKERVRIKDSGTEGVVIKVIHWQESKKYIYVVAPTMDYYSEDQIESIHPVRKKEKGEI